MGREIKMFPDGGMHFGVVEKYQGNIQESERMTSGKMSNNSGEGA